MLHDIDLTIKKNSNEVNLPGQSIIALLPSLYLVNSSHCFSLPIRAISLFSENFHDLEMTLLQVLAYLVPNIFSCCLKMFVMMVSNDS